jgi:hypothetical protein
MPRRGSAPPPAVRLYGRDSAMVLVREFLSRPERGGVPRSRRVPVLTFVGSRGSGKSALLTELERRLDQRVPHARVNCESMADLSVPKVLSALAFELNRRCGKYGRLAFPRFITGQLMIEQELSLDDPARARAQAERALERYRDIDRFRAFLAETAPEPINQFSGTARNVVQAREIHGPIVFGNHAVQDSAVQDSAVQDSAERDSAERDSAVPDNHDDAVVQSSQQSSRAEPGISAAGRYLPDLILKGLTSWRRVVLGEGPRWYGHQDRGLGRDPMEVLVTLHRQAAHPDVEDNRREVGELLWAAFLADLREGFRRGHRADERSLNCAVLLDDIDNHAGLGFVEGLVRARRQHAVYAPDDPDPLTVVATGRGAFSAGGLLSAGSVPTAVEATYADYLERYQGQGWYPVLLGDLSYDEVGNMVAASVPHVGMNRRITTAVHGFTDGHPGSTRLLLDAIAEQPVGGTNLHTILDAIEPGALESEPLTVEQRLLRRFLQGIPTDAWEDLVTIAAARDRAQALRLAAHSELLTASRGERSLIFGPELWTDDEVIRPVLRRLLLRRLAARDSDHPASWSVVHGWFRGNCAEMGEDVGECYHALALGEMEFVTGRLADLLSTEDVKDWLDMLAAVTAAPNRLDPEVAPRNQVQALTEWVDPHDVPRAPLARLVAARWIAEDPLGDSHRRGLYLEIFADYDEIAPYSRNGLAVLRSVAEKYHSEATFVD